MIWYILDKIYGIYVFIRLASQIPYVQSLCEVGSGPTMSARQLCFLRLVSITTTPSTKECTSNNNLGESNF
jgi:hypothetical protein